MPKKRKFTENKSTDKETISKIIYFDKETIRNILQQYYKGAKQTVINEVDGNKIKIESDIESEAKVKLALPFFTRLRFLFSSQLSAEHISQFDKTVTVTSTEISDFEKVKEIFKQFNNVEVSDIENSSTFFRVAGNYTRILKGGVKDVDIKEFKNVMEGYEGYDHYKIDENTYVRFNSTAFLSNYKRNDLLNSKLKIYGIFIGSFPKSNFDFIAQINKMQSLSSVTPHQTIGDMYPRLSDMDCKTQENEIAAKIKTSDEPQVLLYDVVYASISQEKNFK